jgi:hypothetical protein
VAEHSFATSKFSAKARFSTFFNDGMAPAKGELSRPVLELQLQYLGGNSGAACALTVSVEQDDHLLPPGNYLASATNHSRVEIP